MSPSRLSSTASIPCPIGRLKLSRKSLGSFHQQPSKRGRLGTSHSPTCKEKLCVYVLIIIRVPATIKTWYILSLAILNSFLRQSNTRCCARTSMPKRYWMLTGPKFPVGSLATLRKIRSNGYMATGAPLGQISMCLCSQPTSLSFLLLREPSDTSV